MQHIAPLAANRQSSFQLWTAFLEACRYSVHEPRDEMTTGQNRFITHLRRNFDRLTRVIQGAVKVLSPERGMPHAG